GTFQSPYYQYGIERIERHLVFNFADSDTTVQSVRSSRTIGLDEVGFIKTISGSISPSPMMAERSNGTSTAFSKILSLQQAQSRPEAIGCGLAATTPLNNSTVDS